MRVENFKLAVSESGLRLVPVETISAADTEELRDQLTEVLEAVEAPLYVCEMPGKCGGAELIEIYDFLVEGLNEP